MVRLLRSRLSPISFDVGANGVRGCQVQARGNRAQLCDVLTFDRPNHAHDDEEESVGPKPAALARLIERGNFRGRDVALVLSPPDVHFFPLRLPAAALRQTPESLQQALRWEVSRQSRGASDQIEVRHWLLPAARGQEANVMAVALDSNRAERLCDQFSQHGLTVRRIDVSPCALVRAARLHWSPAEHDVWGMLDLGLRHSLLTVVVGTIPTYVRSLTVTHDQLTRRIAEAFEVPYQLAERLKCERGIATDAREARAVTPRKEMMNATDLPRVLGGVLNDTIRNLAREIERCFTYVLQSHPDAALNRLMLAGGGARLSGLADSLASALGIPTAVLTSKAAADAAVQGVGEVTYEPQSAMAVGGALLGLEWA